MFCPEAWIWLFQLCVWSVAYRIRISWMSLEWIETFREWSTSRAACEGLGSFARKNQGIPLNSPITQTLNLTYNPLEVWYSKKEVVTDDLMAGSAGQWERARLSLIQLEAWKAIPWTWSEPHQPEVCPKWQRPGEACDSADQKNNVYWSLAMS